jgi:hypothetical protein
VRAPRCGDSGGIDDLGIDQHHQRILSLRDVDDDDLPGEVHLRGRQTDPGRRVHGLGHVADQLLEAIVEHGHRGRHLVQTGVRVAKDA